MRDGHETDEDMTRSVGSRGDIGGESTAGNLAYATAGPLIQ